MARPLVTLNAFDKPAARDDPRLSSMLGIDVALTEFSRLRGLVTDALPDMVILRAEEWPMSSGLLECQDQDVLLRFELDRGLLDLHLAAKDWPDIRIWLGDLAVAMEWLPGDDAKVAAPEVVLADYLERRAEIASLLSHEHARGTLVKAHRAHQERRDRFKAKYGRMIGG